MTAEQLGPTIIIPDATPIKPVSQEIEARNSIGVALLIVGIDPHKNGDNTNPLIWTIRELRGKSETDKIVGELSIPAETKKAGESRLENILGALAEFGNDESLAYLREHLCLMSDAHIDGGILIHDNPVDMSVLIYDGFLENIFIPLSRDEVGPNGWLRRDKIQNMVGVRSVMKQAIELDRASGLSARVIEEYYLFPEKRISIFPKDFVSIRNFDAKRELSPDVAIYVKD